MRGKSPNLEPEAPSSKATVLVVADLKPKKLLPDVRSTTPKNAGGGQDGLRVGGKTPRALRPHASPSTSLLGGHSEVDPRLPIPNRTVKRLSADASADCPRESRSPPGAPKNNPQGPPWGFVFLGSSQLTCFRNENTPRGNLNRSGRPACAREPRTSRGCVSVQANLGPGPS